VPCSMVLWVGLRLRLAALCAHPHAHSLCRCVQTGMRRMHSQAAHSRAAQRSRAWRAGKYNWGEAGKIICPDGTARIDDLTACQAAATAAGKNGAIRENSDLFPKGCYSSTTSPNVYFNAHVTGATTQIDADILLLCAGTGVPASLTRPASPTASPHIHHGCCHSECDASNLERRPAGGASLGVLGVLRPMRGTLQYLSAVVVLAPGTRGCMRVVHTVGRSIWLAATTTATPTTATPTLLPSPSPTSAPTPPPAAGMRTGMGVSTSCMRHVHRHAARACNVYVCTHIYAGVLPEYSQSTARGSSRAADIGTDAVLIDSILTGYSAGRWVLKGYSAGRWLLKGYSAGRWVITGYRFGTDFGTVRVAHGVFVHARMRMRVQPSTFSARRTPTPAGRGTPRSRRR
jgi:hypothetical protein